MGKNNRNKKKEHMVVKYQGNGSKMLEVLCLRGTMTSFRAGKIGINECLLVEEIFSDASKFKKANMDEVYQTFGHTDLTQALDEILKKGTFSLTKLELQTKIKQNTGEILNYLHKHYHDPTKDPVVAHPISRLEHILRDMKVHVDPHIPVQNQLKPIINRLPDFLRVTPIGFDLSPNDHMKKDNQSMKKNNQSMKKNNQSKKGNKKDNLKFKKFNQKY